MEPQKPISSPRNLRAWGSIYAKGIAMGAADLVPGVSGGTVAFVTGIYDELLATIAGIRWPLIQILLRGEFTRFWREANANFLVALLAGIGTSVVSLAGLFHYLLNHHPVTLWAFFFGLVAASVPLMSRSVEHWNLGSVVSLLVGLGTALWVTALPPLVQSDAPLFLLLCGAIGVCAMILPGISGSFILLILGAYAPVIAALKGFDWIRIIAFVCGAVGGLLAFSKVLNLLLSRFRTTTLSLLTGFLVGSLQALWPWKKDATLLYTHSDGREEWLKVNRWPTDPALPGDPELWHVALACLAGALLVSGLDAWARRMARTQATP
jgi:putative membrane protein